MWMASHKSGIVRAGRHPFKTNKAAHVVDEVRHSDLAPRADDADGAHELGSHAVLLITKYMLDAGAHLRARRIGGLLRVAEFAIFRSRVARIENIFELLTVVHARVAHHVTAH